MAINIKTLFKQKIEKVRKSLNNKDIKCDAFFVSNLQNIWYLTNFSASFAYLLITKTTVILISDSRYSVSAQKLCNELGIIYKEYSSDKKFWNKINERIKESIKERREEIENIRLGIEASDLNLIQFKKLKEQFINNINLIETENIIEQIRIQKTKEEIKILKKSAEIGDLCLQKVVDNFRENISEKELAWIFEKTAREEYKTSGLSFDVIVAFGDNSASPHHESSDKKLEKNMPILIDCGVKYQNYCSDLTRCFWFGEKTGENYKNWESVYETVKKAQKIGIEKMKINNFIAESEKSARKYFELNNIDSNKYFGHSFGHGVGIDIHELPNVSAKNLTEKYQANMVITAEPGLYFSDNSQKINFGIRIEDLLYISEETGCAKYLSSFKK